MLDVFHVMCFIFLGGSYLIKRVFVHEVYCLEQEAPDKVVVGERLSQDYFYDQIP